MKPTQPARFDPAELLDVETVEQIRRVPAESEGLFVRRLNDDKLAAIAAQAPRLRHLIADGGTDVTDTGLSALAAFTRLECLDLEWSRVTDHGLDSIASVSSLRWVDLGFCPEVSSQGVAELRRLRPDLEIVDTH
jgi:hypothetical protein